MIKKLLKKEQSTNEIIKLLYIIGDNHHRSSDFFNRLIQVIEYLTKERLHINDKEIIDVFKGNKRLLLLFFEHKIKNPDENCNLMFFRND